MPRGAIATKAGRGYQEERYNLRRISNGFIIDVSMSDMNTGDYYNEEYSYPNLEVAMSAIRGFVTEREKERFVKENENQDQGS